MIKPSVVAESFTYLEGTSTDDTGVGFQDDTEERTRECENGLKTDKRLTEKSRRLIS